MSNPVTTILSEADVKAIVLARLHAYRRITSNATIANEYRLGNSGVRADLAILDKSFIGIEIKSPKDSLRRLATQLKSYDLYFDLTILVVAEKHLPNLEVDLSTVELWTVSDRGKLKTVSKPTRARSKELRKNLADLLPVRQRRRIQESAQSFIAGNLEMELFERYFRNRFSTTSKNFWQASSTNNLGSADLSSLSVYKPLRINALARAQQRARVFKDWESKS